jgi:SAM-dependent methyltransferase
VTGPARTAYGKTVDHAGAEFWDCHFERRRESGEDLDWGGVWTEPFLLPMQAARLADVGYSVVAIDLSREAAAQAQATYGARVSFLVADMTQHLPFADGAFDALMSNVALHMFRTR